MMRLCYLLPALMLGCLLAGCQSTPYVAPSSVCVRPSGEALDSWWQQFGDSELNRVLQLAQACNIDLGKKALEAQRYQLESGRWDAELQAQVSVSSQQPLAGGAALQSINSRFSVAYELDVWGRMARSHDVARWLAQASRVEQRALSLSLQASVAVAYWQRQAFVERVRLARQDQETQRQLLALTQLVVDSGAEPARALWSQQQAVLQSEQRVSQLERGQEDAGVRLAAWLEQTAPPEMVTPWQRSAPLPVVASGLPADLLARRPDVAAQEARLRSRLAARDVAQASFMPALTLTGALGSSSQTLAQLLSQPSATLLASLSLPFVNWQNLSISRAQADIDYQAVALDYRRSVMQALREVGDALAWHARLRGDLARAEQELRVAVASEQEVALRVALGDSDQMVLYREQLLLRARQDALITLQLEQRINLATLYKALGGAAVAG